MEEAHEVVGTVVIDTAGAAGNKIIEKNPAELHWITVSQETVGSKGIIKIYDGMDAGGRLAWQMECGYSGHHNFIPAIDIHQGIFAVWDAAVGSFTIGWHPTGWQHKPRPSG